MKSYLNEQEANNNIEFPVLMRSLATGNIVLFTNETTGTVVYLGGNNNNQFILGEHSATFAHVSSAGNWVKHSGIVYLKN